MNEDKDLAEEFEKFLDKEGYEKFADKNVVFDAEEKFKKFLIEVKKEHYQDNNEKFIEFVKTFFKLFRVIIKNTKEELKFGSADIVKKTDIN